MTSPTGTKAARADARAVRQTGFSLVEVCVAVAIVALLTAVAVPTLGNLTRVELRRGGRQLAADMRRAFDEAALTGQTYRVVFSMAPPPGSTAAASDDAPPPISIEAAEGTLTFSGRDGALKMADAGDPNEDADLSSFENYFSGSDTTVASVPPAKDDATSASGDTMRAMFGINAMAQKANRPQFVAIGAVTLSRGIGVVDVWVEGMPEVESHGIVALLMFPAGYTQHALVHLGDGQGNYVTVEVEPQTGRASVLDGYVTLDEVQRGDGHA